LHPSSQLCNYVALVYEGCPWRTDRTVLFLRSSCDCCNIWDIYNAY